LSFFLREGRTGERQGEQNAEHWSDHGNLAKRGGALIRRIENDIVKVFAGEKDVNGSLLFEASAAAAHGTFADKR
jgi:hypothetical protein